LNRIKLTLPPSFPFSTRIRIRITDLNYGGHVGNDTFLSLVQEARQQFLNTHGYGELEFEGIGLIMADAGIEFKSELNFGDEVEIHVAPADFTKFGFDLYYKMEIVHPSGNILAGKVKTGMLCYDYKAKKLAPLPPAALAKLSV
jgi:YbgC/YbaW family acyl-CoA thioester hydrolase